MLLERVFCMLSHPLRQHKWCPFYESNSLIWMLPVFIEASRSLVLGFAPVVPASFFDACIHVCICKDNSPKRAPRSPKIHIWTLSIASYYTSASAQRDCHKDKRAIKADKSLVLMRTIPSTFCGRNTCLSGKRKCPYVPNSMFCHFEKWKVKGKGSNNLNFTRPIIVQLKFKLHLWTHMLYLVSSTFKKRKWKLENLFWFSKTM